MDHSSEFGSDRFFAKLREQEQQTGVQTTENFPETLTFILPVREGKCTDEGARAELAREQQKKARFTGLKSLLKHSSENDSRVDRRKSIQYLGHLFLELPVELQLSILELLSISDIFTLRLVSRHYHNLITATSTPIARLHFRHNIPAYALRLYPLPTNESLYFQHLCRIWSRLNTAAKITHLTCDWVIDEIFLQKTLAKKMEFAGQRERMRRRLIPLVFTMYHFFESYRELHLQHVLTNPGYALRWVPYTVNPIEARIMSMYDDTTLLRVHEAFPLVISTFCRQLKPPSYIGTLEKSIRGYLKDKVSDEVTTAIILLGGPQMMGKFWSVLSYGHRRTAVDNWWNSLLTDRPVTPARLTQVTNNGGVGSSSQAAAASAPVKSKHKFLGRLSRKKSTAGLKDTSVASVDPMTGVQSTDYAHTPLVSPFPNGRPMPPLTPEQNRLLLPDMPILQHIWTVTAEALIIHRGIVQRPEHIKRNVQLLYDLIREPTMADEDEIWYGRNREVVPGRRTGDGDVVMGGIY